MSAIVRYLLVAAALVAAYYSAVFARASFLYREDSPASGPAAAYLVPYNSAYLARLAEWQPSAKVALLHRAVELNPFDVHSWIQLGLTAEMEQHDIRSAERYYLQAWRAGRMFLPRWTLANFYFRRQNREEFFRWAKSTLEITPYPADPVFTEMWLMSPNAEQITAYIPDRAGILLQYASFLANAHEYAHIARTVDRLIASVGTRNPADYGRDDQIAPIVDRLLAAGDLQPASDIWRSMKQANWVALPAPTPAHPLNNGDFRFPFFNHGFDWVQTAPNGVTLDQSPVTHNVRIIFAGSEPEHCVLLQQYIPLDPNRSYRLTWQADDQGIELPSGLAWHLHTMPESGHPDLAAGDLLRPAQPVWEFHPPAGSLYLLTLEYTRPVGSIRPTGHFAVRGVSLKEQ